MAKKRIYELLNKAVLTVSDLFMIDKSGDALATNVSGQQIVDLVDANISRVESVSGADVDNTDPLNPIVNTPSLAFTDLQDVPTDYTGEGGKYVMVALTEDGLVFNTVSGVDTNIYNTNGTLTANRTVTGGGFTLTFDAKTTVKAYSNLSTETAFNVRSLDNTKDYISVSGNGKINIDPGSTIDSIGAMSFTSAGLTDFSAGSGVKVNYLRTDVWNNAGSTDNLVTWNFGAGAGFFRIHKPTQVMSPSASVLDTAFAVRNNTDTNSHFQVRGNGSVYSQGKNFGSRDTIYGINAGANIDPAAYYLTFFGFQAGLGVTGGACSAFGDSCMQGDSTLSSAFGSGALVLGGSSMCAFGTNSARKIGNQRGVFMGNDAGYDWANSISNTLIGWGVASGITSGNNNVIIGGYNVTTPSTLVTSNRNTLIGDEQAQFPAVMKGTICLGYRAEADGDNQFSIGSVEENAGAVVTEGFTQALTWAVTINGVKYKIPLQLA